MSQENLLYKYFSSERIEVLRSLQVRFTRPAELNDPFECRFQLGAPEHELEVAVADNFNAESAQIDVWVHSVLGALGVFCCTKEPASEVMWAHYANNHRGFLLGFDRQKNPFLGPAFVWGDYRTQFDLTQIQGFGTFRDVEYSDTPYSIPFGGDIPFDALFRKKMCWSHEREVRIFRSLDGAARIIDDSIHLFTIPLNALATIIIGANADNAIERTVKLLMERPELQHVEFQQAALASRSQKICFEPIRRGNH